MFFGELIAGIIFYFYQKRLKKKNKIEKKEQYFMSIKLLTKEDEYYTPKDLILGNYVYVYNRPCRLIDCDEFTKRWYKEK